MERGQPIANGVDTLVTDLPYATDGHVVVDVTAIVTDALVARLTALGMEVLSSSPESGTLRVHLDIDQVEALAALPDVSFVQPQQQAQIHQATPNVLLTQTGQGAKSSQGDITHLAYAARAAFGINGTGVKIGVLSDGVATLPPARLPATSGRSPCCPGQTGSGRRRHGDARDRPRPRAGRAVVLRDARSPASPASRTTSAHCAPPAATSSSTTWSTSSRRRSRTARRRASVDHQRRRRHPGGERRDRGRRAVFLVGGQLRQLERRHVRHLGRRLRRRRHDAGDHALTVRQPAQLRRPDLHDHRDGGGTGADRTCPGPIRSADPPTTTTCSG